MKRDIKITWNGGEVEIKKDLSEEQFAVAKSALKANVIRVLEIIREVE